MTLDLAVVASTSLRKTTEAKSRKLRKSLSWNRHDESHSSLVANRKLDLYGILRKRRDSETV